MFQQHGKPIFRLLNIMDGQLVAAHAEQSCLLFFIRTYTRKHKEFMAASARGSYGSNYQLLQAKYLHGKETALVWFSRQSRSVHKSIDTST